MNKIIHVATFAYVVNSENKVLLLRRAKNDTFPGTWELPGGGFEAGEDPKESIEREVFEEAGLQVIAIRPLAVITHSSHSKDVEIVRITYECKLIDLQEKVVLSHEHDAYQWIDESDLPVKQDNGILKSVIKEMRRAVGGNPSISAYQ